ncbi:MAG: hypothetical protein WBS33_04490, partial [Verrucomicrobiia bacterium]
MFGFLGGDRAVKENCNSMSDVTRLKVVQLWRSGGLFFAEFVNAYKTIIQSKAIRGRRHEGNIQLTPTARNRTQPALAEAIFLRCLSTRACHLLLWCVVLLQPGVGKAELPAGPWTFSGIVNDDLKGANGSVVMHQTLAVSGYFEDGSFVVDVDPRKSPQNIWESAGWDGKLLRIVQNFSDKPGPGQPRNRWLGTVEPNVFSRHATPATTSILMAFADTNILARMRQGRVLIILGERRLYPEENNTYEIKEFPSGGLEIRATCPGQKVARGGNTPIPGFEHGFT